jgi:hypothetical protein
VPAQISGGFAGNDLEPAADPKAGGQSLVMRINSVPVSWALIPPQFEANARVGVRTEIPAASVVHSLTGGNAMLLRHGERARSGPDNESQSHCGLGEHTEISCFFVIGAIALRSPVM